MKKLVWVIDDDEGILDVTKIVLEDAGYRVETIESEARLKEQLKSELPCLILLDVLISGVSGVEVGKTLKSNEVTKDIPIVLMSANPDLETRAKEAMADSYLKKPYDIVDLEKKVKEYCS